MPKIYLIAPILLGALVTGCLAKSSQLHHTDLAPCNGETAAPDTLRVVSYNIKAGVDSSLEAIADVLRELDGDIVAIQEIDFGVPRTDSIDQTEALAQALGYPHFAFAGARKRQGGDFGVAVLSRLPLAAAERVDLHGGLRAQPRAAVDTTVCVGEAPLRFVSVHTDFVPPATRRDARILRARFEEEVGLGVIIAGDLNARPHTRPASKLRAIGLSDLLAEIDDGPTFPGFPGAKRIDYFLADAPMGVFPTDGGVMQTDASDHYPIWVEVPVRPLLAVHGLLSDETELAAADADSQADDDYDTAEAGGRSAPEGRP
jgi:endonuclease/exonuclease/phosphatase family metal-dependent hydrolase